VDLLAGGNVTRFMQIRDAMTFIEMERMQTEKSDAKDDGPRYWWKVK